MLPKMHHHQNRLNSVLSSLQTQESMENAIGNYHMIMDKWLATAAGVWAMGGNPLSTPLPWGPFPGINVVQSHPPQAAPVKQGSWVKPALFAAVMFLGLGVLGAGITLWVMRPASAHAVGSPTAPLITPETEWGVQVKVGDGSWGPWRPLPKENP